MTYVDGLRDRGWHLGPSSHLIADMPDELHAFAALLGMRRGWAQTSRAGVPHYDLTARRRALAVALGAMDCQDRAGMKRFLAVMRKARTA
jgi:hypothetical protein